VVSITLGELAERVNARIDGDSSSVIDGVATLANAVPGKITFLTTPRYRKHLVDTQASAVILTEDDRSHCPVNALISDNPYLTYAQVSALFAPARPAPGIIDATAIVSKQATLHESVTIGANSVIGNDVVLAAGVIIGAGCVIGDGAIIDEDSRIFANVTLYHDVILGKRVTVHSGTVIGSDGFGFANERGRWIKIHQLGRAVIGDDVEIGANTTIDRGAIEDTVIGDGVILDNQIQVAHNVQIGAHTAVAGCVGIAGSAVIGSHCAIGGGVGILGHLEICDGVTVTAMSLVTRSIKEPGIYSSGTPLEPSTSWQKNFARFKQLDEMARRLKRLEKEFEHLIKG
jgi:UDP-3-O-[3-hydroxymyristoyl] glucosamine N-acyltransferase